MRPQLPLLILTVALVGCRTHQARFSNYTPPAAPDVITMRLLPASPVLTQEKVESLRSLLLTQRFRQLEDLKAALPKDFLFLGVCYTLKSPFDASGKMRPYTESVFVCRLNEDHDLVVVEDDRTGKDTIQNWFIRDLPIHSANETISLNRF